jgi:hypothetical protein
VTIFTAIHNNRYTDLLDEEVSSVISDQGYDAVVYKEVIEALASGNPMAISTLGLPEELTNSITQLYIRSTIRGPLSGWRSPVSLR